MSLLPKLLVKKLDFKNFELKLKIAVLTKAVSNSFIKSSDIMMRTQALFPKFYVAWLNLPPQPPKYD